MSWLVAIALLCGSEYISISKIECQKYVIKCSRKTSKYSTPSDSIIANCYLDWDIK